MRLTTLSDAAAKLREAFVKQPREKDEASVYTRGELPAMSADVPVLREIVTFTRD